MLIALTTPAVADISDYDSMHRRLADVLGSRAQADAAYDKLKKEANTYDQPIASMVICSSQCARQAMNVTRNPSGYGSGMAASDRFANGKKAGLR